jgi:hypothetical protein
MFINGIISVRILDAGTKEPLYETVHDGKNHIVTRSGVEYIIEYTLTSPDSNGNCLYFYTFIDGKCIDSLSLTDFRSTRTLQVQGFRVCDDAGQIIGRKAFKIVIPDTVEPGSAKANVNADTSGVITLKAYSAKETGVIREQTTFKSTCPEESAPMQEKSKSVIGKKGGPPPVTLGGRTIATQERPAAANSMVADQLLGCVHVYPITAFALQVRGVNMNNYWATAQPVADEEEEEEEDEKQAAVAAPRDQGFKEDDKPLKKPKLEASASSSSSSSSDVIDLT